MVRRKATPRPEPEPERMPVRWWAALLLAALLIAAGCRLVQSSRVLTRPEMTWQGQPKITTSDGYFFAGAARAQSEGKAADFYHGQPVLPLSSLTGGLARWLPVSFEQLVYYLPILLGSLLVVPVMLAGWLLRLPDGGFLAALFSSLSVGFFNRTCGGYFDTDILVLPLAVAILAAILAALRHRHPVLLLAVTLTFTLYERWYPSGYLLAFLLLGMLAVYVAVYRRRDLDAWEVVVFGCLGLLGTGGWWRLGLAVMLAAGLSRPVRCPDRVRKWILLAVAAGFAVSVPLTSPQIVLKPLRLFVTRDFSTHATRLRYQDVIETVAENRIPGFGDFCQKAFGSVPAVLAGLAGFGLLWYRRTFMLLFLPLLIVAATAFAGGIRFALFATVPLSLGAGALLAAVASGWRNRGWKYGVPAAAAALILWPNLQNVFTWIDHPPVQNRELAVLEEFSRLVKPEDLAMTWWSDGYVVQYYGRIGTAVDGGRNAGDLNFPVAYQWWTGDACAARNLAFLSRLYPWDRGGLERMMTDRGFQDPAAFLRALPGLPPGRPLPPGQVYLVLLEKQLRIFNQIARCANRNLLTGQPGPESFYYYAPAYRQSGNGYDCGNGVMVNVEDRSVQRGGESFPLRRVYRTVWNRQARRAEASILDEGAFGELNLIFMPDNAMLILDRQLLESLFIQLFVFTNPGPACCEPVLLDENIKIYRYLPPPSPPAPRP